MTQKILAGNWKMHKTRDETRKFFDELSGQLAASPVRKIVCPGPTLLETALVAAEGTGVEIFAQNCHWAKQGAFTGEVSPLQLKDLGVQGTLVGHSERRQYFGETDETCQMRAAAALEQGLDVIYCVGESLEERKSGRTRAVLEKQLLPVRTLEYQRLILAYEPVWAIGTGLTAETAQVAEAHAWIRELLKRDLPILYGGSVKPSNFADLASVPHVAGGLVGGASLEAASFLALHNCLV